MTTSMDRLMKIYENMINILSAKNYEKQNPIWRRSITTFQQMVK